MKFKEVNIHFFNLTVIKNLTIILQYLIIINFFLNKIDHKTILLLKHLILYIHFNVLITFI